MTTSFQAHWGMGARPHESEARLTSHSGLGTDQAHDAGTTAAQRDATSRPERQRYSSWTAR